MKFVILYILLCNSIYLVFSKNGTNNCWEQQRLFITINDLPSLLNHFVICLAKCHQLKNKECFIVASQLKSSVLALRDLYYHGQISFWMMQDFNNLYNEAKNICPSHPKLITNWLVVKNENYPILYDMELMLAKDDKHICNELIIIAKEYDGYGVMQLIPIPSFDTVKNPQHLILPYKNDFMIKIKDTHENTIIYKTYFQSMKCMNIINNNSIKVNFLNKHFKNWIVNTVIPVAKSTPDILPGFGAIYRIVNLTEEFEKSIKQNYESQSENNEIIEGYPNMTYGLMKNNSVHHYNVRINELFKTNGITETSCFIIILVICLAGLLLFHIFYKNCNHTYGNISLPLFELDFANISNYKIKEILCANNVHGYNNKMLGKKKNVKDCLLSSSNHSNSSPVQINNDTMTIDAIRYNTLSQSDFRVYARRETLEP